MVNKKRRHFTRV